MADMDGLLCGRLSAECHIYLVGVNTIMECREFCGVHSWENGTRWCETFVVSFPSSLVGI